MTRLIIYTVKLIAAAATLALWIFPMSVVCSFLVIRTVASYSIAVISTLYTGGSVPKEAQDRLEHMAAIWPRGFAHIVATLYTNTSPGALLKAQHPIQMVQDTFLAIFLYTWLFVSWHWTAQNYSVPYDILYSGWLRVLQFYKDLQL